MRRDLGDFQTPPALASAVLDRLDALGVRCPRVLEPTCGRGHFVAALLDRPTPPAEVRGFEVQPAHLEVARRIARSGTLIGLEQADLFAVDLATRPRWETDGPLLVIGNPPWVTSAELGRLDSVNRPARSRVAGLSGLDARTGRANFDLAEAVWQKLLDELPDPDATIALLCKTTSARNVLRWASAAGRPIASASIHRIDAPRWFGATVDACLFVVRLGAIPPDGLHADVYPDLASDRPTSTVGVVDGALVADLAAFNRARSAYGTCRLAWRQGVKHDAAAVMELTESADGLRNGLGEAVDVEPDYVYPLMKGADLGRPGPPRPSRRVIVTQRRLGDDTRSLERSAPRLWAYLTRHAGAFEARRSRVHAGRPPFAIFGVGDYTFATHKVAVSGLHKSVIFHAIGPVNGRPVLFDDTCYFLSIDDQSEADRLRGLLASTESRALIEAIRFPEAKRPITKAILSRIDLDALQARTLAGVEGVE